MFAVQCDRRYGAGAVNVNDRADERDRKLGENRRSVLLLAARRAEGIRNFSVGVKDVTSRDRAIGIAIGYRPQTSQGAGVRVVAP